MSIGRVGVWQGGYGPTVEADRALVGEVEALGYGAFWFGEAPGGKDAFVRTTTLLAATSRLTVATGIASIWGRDPLSMASAIATVGEAFPGRFIAGIGVSHPPAVVARGARYEQPFSTLREHLAAMQAMTMNFPTGTELPPVVLAALRPAMLALAGTQAAGAHPYFVPVEHTRRARGILGPNPLLAPELAVVLEPDPTEARRLARLHTGSFYLEAPNYRNALLWLGYDEEDLAHGGSDRLVDDLVAWGDEAAIVRRVQEHLDAGADHVCLQPVTEIRPLYDGPDTQALGVLRRLAPALRAAQLFD